MMNDVSVDDIDIEGDDLDDIDSTDDADIFENVGDRIGKAVLKKRATVLTAFNQFLMRIGYVPNNFDDLSTHQLTNFRDVMGQFPDYLMKVRKISCIKSNQNYVSCMKEMIISRAPNSDIVQGVWYTRLRTNIEKMYVQAAMDNGTTLHKDSNYTNENDLVTLCRSLITDNTAISISMRSLLCFEWYCHGRINEVAEHLHSNKFDAYFGNGIRCLKGRLLRGKTFREDDILFMIHATDWTICPIHSFASLLACNNITLKLYPFISQSRGGDSVNQLLKRKCKEHDCLTPKLTSKCFKTGAATSLNEHPNSKETNVVLRLGHEVKKIQTSYHYVLKTTKTEAQTARLMSGWNDPLYGGTCPWIEAISEDERESFQYYATNLIGCHHLTSNLVLLAAVVLVLNYRSVLRWYKQELYNINCQSDEESRSFNLFKNAIRLLKRFLPDNSILERRPSSDHTSLRAWLHNLGRLSATIEGRSLAFCEQHKKPSNNQVRQRKLQPFFEGIYKRLNELSFDPRVQFPTPVGVVDHCIPNEMNSTV